MWFIDTKGGFARVQCLFTLSWALNFKSEPNLCIFMPLWISLLLLPLEYQVPNLVEKIANKLGIFVKHDLIPFEESSLTVRVYHLLNTTMTFPTNLHI